MKKIGWTFTMLVLTSCLISNVVMAADEGRVRPAPGKQAASNRPVAVAPRGLPTDAQATAQIEAAFTRWSATWMTDRYIARSTRIGDRGLKDNVFLIRGTFDFLRFGTKFTIPFAAAFSKNSAAAAGSPPYAISQLCYTDTSSGMVDCVGSSAEINDRHAAAMQSRQLMGAIIAIGLMDAMSSGYDGDGESDEYETPGDCGYERPGFMQGPADSDGYVWVCH